MVYSLENSSKWPCVVVTLLLFVSIGVAIFTLVTTSDSMQEAKKCQSDLKLQNYYHSQSVLKWEKERENLLAQLETSRTDQARLQAIVAQGEENLKTVNSALILCQEQTDILYTNLTLVENQVLMLKSEHANVTAEMQGEIDSLRKNLTRISQELQSTNQQYTQAMESKQAADSLNREQLSKIKTLKEEVSALSGVNKPVLVHSTTALCIMALLMAL
ncbi:uncharacterized protein LOC131702793 [Acipenser ruthenus]|uniref:uncharacterized protein LOC131702793 n=1 Tax=Acipenser ruthenus TaxID=7906 RepID=UPI002741CB9E|nr:uncharacterized protein LOC131702793 [Acipenser ruthenus]